MSADDLREWARKLELPGCQVIESDGMTAVVKWLETRAGRRLVHIGPFDNDISMEGRG